MARKRTIDIGGEEITLTDREIMFVEHYLLDTNMNATGAAKKAGYSAKTARHIASETLTKPNVSKYIAFKTRPTMDQMGITQDRVLRELAVIAFSNITDYLEPDCSLMPLDRMDPSKVGAIKDVEKTDTGYKLRLYDKLSALHRLWEILNRGNGGKEDSNSDFFSQINNYYENKQKP